MGLDGNVLGSKLVPSNNNLVNIVLGLGHSLGLQERIDYSTGGRSRCSVLETGLVSGKQLENFTPHNMTYN